MNHAVARRLLISLPDGLLPAPTEAAVRSHAAECPVCGAALAEIEATERLLRRLPASLVPQVWTEESEARLEAFARWSPPEPGPLAGWWERWSAPALLALAAAAGLAVLLQIDRGGRGPLPRPPVAERREAPVVLAAIDPEPRAAVRAVALPVVASPGHQDATYLPVGLR